MLQSTPKSDTQSNLEHTFQLLSFLAYKMVIIPYWLVGLWRKKLIQIYEAAGCSDDKYYREAEQSPCLQNGVQVCAVNT